MDDSTRLRSTAKEGSSQENDPTSQMSSESLPTQSDTKTYNDMSFSNNEDSKKESAEVSQAATVRIAGYSFNKIVLVAHVNIFLYSTCFWIQNAVFPYLSKRLGADPVIFGYLQTTFAVVQLAGSPLFGRFGDLFGSRVAMILAYLSAASSYFLLYLSSNMTLLFISRLPSVFMHAMQGGQMIVTDVCNPKERAAALGKLGLSYGIGMVVGPIAGGLVSKFFSLETGALLACFGSLLSVLLIVTFVPAQVKKVQKPGAGETVFSLNKIGQLLAAPGALFLMVIKLGTGIPIGIFQSMFTIITLEIFKLPPEQNSALMSYVGVMGMIVQGVGVSYAAKAFSEHTLLMGSAGILAISYLLLAYASSIFQMCIIFVPLITGLTFQNIVTTSALTHTVPDSDTGAMLGLSMAVNSLIRSISPTAGGYMLENLGFESFGWLGFFLSAAVTVVLFLRQQRSE
ncbi:solute carrier family 22 member 18 [Aplysia californica]|uniref:Solute carrier family 22 member 18 n=1 Tax=Aplysia californica TaxID=6500 RepID=A0ABM0K5S4_APLCA|nr:solute carrier family 22 member 18 [Aplysia californica]